ncbi:MAG: NAD(P)-binding domain-containing protein, partial [Chloroflexi bacterium]|nr:NAD(P)-binding domain-containing protein [Chloroflexota bacterium]
MAPYDIVVVGGGGHVGLPLSLKLAEAGLRVAIFDISEGTVASIREGRMPFQETGAEELLGQMLPTGRLAASTDPEILRGVPIAVVVIGTPIDEFFNPSMAIFDKAVDQLAPHLADGALVVLRSTVYPGTAAHVRRALLERGCRVDVVFCPERIAEGKALVELGGLPQIVGADDDVSPPPPPPRVPPRGAGPRRAAPKAAELAPLVTKKRG